MPWPLLNDDKMGPFHRLDIGVQRPQIGSSGQCIKVRFWLGADVPYCRLECLELAIKRTLAAKPELKLQSRLLAHAVVVRPRFLPFQ